MATINWDDLFTLLCVKIGEHEDDHIFGEDFVGFDQTITESDLHWITYERFYDDEQSDLKQYKQLVRLIYVYVVKTLRESDLWVGPLRLSNLYFKSGNPLTSELGSWVHLNILTLYCELRGLELQWLTVLSDDDLVCVKGDFDYNDYAEFVKLYGKEITPFEDILYYERDGFVEFLKVTIGRILIDREDIVFVGNLKSRYHGMAQRERGLRESGLEITGDPSIDGTISRLASYGSAAAPVIYEILKGFSNDEEGRKVLAALRGLASGALEYTIIDEDRHWTFSPDFMYPMVTSLSISVEAAS